jgi:hypothetical protein
LEDQGLEKLHFKIDERKLMREREGTLLRRVRGNVKRHDSQDSYLLEGKSNTKGFGMHP